MSTRHIDKKKKNPCQIPRHKVVTKTGATNPEPKYDLKKKPQAERTP